MHMPRRFTVEGNDAFASISFAPRLSRIVNPDGTVVFEMKDVLVPEDWSQVAVDILDSHAFGDAAQLHDPFSNHVHVGLNGFVHLVKKFMQADKARAFYIPVGLLHLRL